MALQKKKNENMSLTMSNFTPVILTNKFHTSLGCWAFSYWALAPFLKGSFLLHPYIFLPASPQFFKFRNWPSPVIWIRDLRVCYGFNNPKVNHVAFWIRGCSRSKVCINCWFPDCWIHKSNFYYGLVDMEWFFSIMNFWIRTYFKLRIGGSIMVFSIMDVLHFFILD